MIDGIDLLLANLRFDIVLLSVYVFYFSDGPQKYIAGSNLSALNFIVRYVAHHFQFVDRLGGNFANNQVCIFF